MQLMIESYVMPEPYMITEYLNMMNNIEAKTFYEEDTEYKGFSTKFIHEIEFEKDLKFSEIIEIKDILYPENILAVWIKDGINKELIIFNKEWMF